MNYAWLFVGAGWLLIVGLSVGCFRLARNDGDRTPQGKMAHGCMGVIGFGFAVLALMPLVELAGRWIGYK